VTVRALREHGKLLQKLAAAVDPDSKSKTKFLRRAREALIASIAACEQLRQHAPLANQHVIELLETRIAVARLAMESEDHRGARKILEQAMGESENTPEGMVLLSRRSRLYRELSKVFSDLGDSVLAHEASRVANVTGREAFRQVMVQGVMFLTSRLWQR
jgi:hypothetical protein